VASTAVEVAILLTAKDAASGVLGKVHKSLALIGTAAIAGAAAAIHMAADFETAMSQVATLSPAVAKNIGGISKQVLELSQVMGVDATKSATALYEAISAGVPAENAIDFLKIATKSAIAGVTDTATSVKGLTTVLNAYKLPASEAEKISDIMFQTVNLGVVRFDELNASMSQVIPMASALGVGFADVGAAVATITKQGTPAALATTQINAAMVALQRTTPEMDKVLKNLGYTTGTAMLKTLGFQGTMEALRKEADRLGIPLIELTGRLEGTSAILQLTGKNAEGARADLEAIRGSTGSTGNAFEIMNKTMNRSLESLQASFGVIMIQIGSKLLPAITPLIVAFSEWLPKAFEAAETAVNKVWPPIETAFKVIVAAIRSPMAAIDEINEIWFSVFGERAPGIFQAFGRIVQEVSSKATEVFAFFGENMESTVFALKAIVFTVLVPMFSLWAFSAGAAAVATIIAFAPVIIALAAVGTAAFLLHKVWTENMGGIQEKTQGVIDFILDIFAALKITGLVIWRSLLLGIAAVINGVIGVINGFIEAYNGVAEKLGLPLLGKIELITPNIAAIDAEINSVARDRWSHINFQVAYIDPGAGAARGSSHAVGIPNVPFDMTTRVHRGERIVPAYQNRQGGGDGGNVINIYADVIDSQAVDRLADKIGFRYTVQRRAQGLA
jgi:TP901 family phage tail tape measure protein